MNRDGLTDARLLCLKIVKCAFNFDRSYENRLFEDRFTGKWTLRERIVHPGIILVVCNHVDVVSAVLQRVYFLCAGVMCVCV